MTWEEMGRYSIRSAKKLFEMQTEDDLRSCVSRTYYAAYAATTSRLSPAQFVRGWGNPGHDQILGLVLTAQSIPVEYRRPIRKKLLILQNARVHADYRPGQTVDRETALFVFAKLAP